MQYSYSSNDYIPELLMANSVVVDLKVMYHNHSPPGVLQLPWYATTSQWNVVQLPIVMHIIMLQHPLVCYNDTRKPMNTS